MKIESIREDFAILNRKINGKKLVYLDSAATSLKPRQVLDAERFYYENSCANIHRGLHTLSEEASIKYEESHKDVAKFVNCEKEEVIFTKNTTESLNLVMYALKNKNFFKKGDKIVVSEMEHHSNIIPWQYLEKQIGVKLEFVNVNDNFELDMSDFETKVKGAKLVSISGASNTIASKPDLFKIEKLAHAEGALFGVDAAQLAPHAQLDFKKLNADFLAFSAHKMLGPTGMGCLIGKKEFLNDLEPFMFGGDMITSVSKHKSSWNNLPYKFEAGTPNIAGAYGLSAAIKYLEKLGLDNIHDHELKLTKYAISEMDKLGIDMFCPKNDKQGGIVLFNCKKIDCHDTAMLLNDEGIAIRSGMHCAEPLISKYNDEGLARASFYLYNTIEEVEYFISKLKEINSI